MAIEKVIIRNLKKFKEPFEISFNENINLLVGDNKSGKSTILEAIYVALTGMYAGRSIRNQLSAYLFNSEVVQEYVESIESGHPTPPPQIMIEIYFKSGTLPEYEGNGNSENSDAMKGIKFMIVFSEKFNADYENLIKSEKLTSLPIEFYEAGKRAQCVRKTQLALSHKQAEKANIILIEEPESHLSFSRLSELMVVIQKAVRQTNYCINA